MAAAPEISGLLRGRGRETATCKTLNIIDFRVELSNNKLLELVDVQPPIAGKSTISHRSAIPHGSLSAPSLSIHPVRLIVYLSRWLKNPKQAWLLILVLLILLINTLLSTATTEGKRSSERKKLYSRLPAQYQPR